MCIDTVSLPYVSRYGDISIYCCISSVCTCLLIGMKFILWCGFFFYYSNRTFILVHQERREGVPGVLGNHPRHLSLGQ